MNESVWEIVRWVNVTAALAVVTLMTASVIGRWDVTPRRLRRVYPLIIATYVIIAYGSGEIATSQTYVQPGLRVMLLLLVLIGLVAVLLFNMVADDEEAHR